MHVGSKFILETLLIDNRIDSQLNIQFLIYYSILKLEGKPVPFVPVNLHFSSIFVEENKSVTSFLVKAILFLFSDCIAAFCSKNPHIIFGDPSYNEHRKKNCVKDQLSLGLKSAY
jgi:hypothetical protein